MHPNAMLLENFYAAFARCDAEAMLACYDPNVTFSDPVFQTLHAARAGAMWRMLTERAQNLQVTASGIQADDQQGQANWVASYTYTPTQRRVRNVVSAQFIFRDGRILLHQDTFDLWKWASQALGRSGALLGWSPFMQAAIRRTAAHTLDMYIERQASA